MKTYEQHCNPIDIALSKQQIAQRIPRELKDSWYVNLGIGIPTSGQLHP